ncbi:hypothetical protein [Hydrogenovibrio kuenenii]|uniref:hypothetical protein n=1 Tax=Hydrogenovibrio kuenenii TaxID=63658 RepID=UPI000464ABD5|nr:hypothetical protein [Hydrogenovibrio kuenenii]
MLYGGSLLVFVPLNLTEYGQGIWFTLMALGAMSRLADMGFLQLVLTFSGHAKVNSGHSKEEVTAFTQAWRNKVIRLVFPLIFFIGSAILLTQHVHKTAILVWFAYIASLAFFFYLNYFLSYIEGEGDVAFAHFSRGLVYIISFVVTSAGLLYLKGVEALALGMFTGVLIVLIGIKWVRPCVFVFIPPGQEMNVSQLKEEFLPLFRRTSMSWTGGYLGTHAIVPLVYMIAGPVASGFAGMTLNVFIALQNFSNVFLVSIIPKVVGSVAEGTKGFASMTVKKSWIKSIAIFYLMSLVLLVSIKIFPNFFIFQRLLTDINLLFLAVGFGLQISVYAVAIYIRAHKSEPFGVMSIVSSTIGLIVLWGGVNTSFNEWYFIGYLASSLVAALWAVKILNTWRHKVE